MDRFESWHRFATNFSENLFFDEKLMNKWATKIFRSDGSGARLKEMVSLFKGIASTRNQIAKFPKDEEHLLDYIASICAKHEKSVIKFFSGDVQPSIQKLILKLALDEAVKPEKKKDKEMGLGPSQQVLLERIREALSQMQIHDADVSTGSSWIDEQLSDSVRMFCDFLDYTEEAKTEIESASSVAQMVSILLDYSTDFEASEVSARKKAQEVKDTVIALQPEYEDQDLEAWKMEMAKSLGVSEEYIAKILDNQKEKPVKKMPVSTKEKELSNGAKFGLNYLSLFNSPLVGTDHYWYIKQYANLLNSERGKN